MAPTEAAATAATTTAHRLLLVRCTVSNQEQQESVRFVERTHFRLWQYMMANRHGLRVREACLALWLPEAEWTAQARLFEHAGEPESVNRLTLAVFDAESSLCHTTQRFVPAADTVLVRRILLERIPEPARSSGDFAFESEMGQAIVRDDADALDQVF